MRFFPSGAYCLPWRIALETQSGALSYVQGCPSIVPQVSRAKSLSHGARSFGSYPKAKRLCAIGEQLCGASNSRNFECLDVQTNLESCQFTICVLGVCADFKGRIPSRRRMRHPESFYSSRGSSPWRRLFKPTRRRRRDLLIWCLCRPSLPKRLGPQSTK